MPDSPGTEPTQATVPGVARADASRPGELPDLPADGRLGRYEILDVLGRGGMGVVVRARDPHLGREVAVKLVRPGAGGSAGGEGGSARLLREAKALAQLSHPNVVAIHDVGAFEGGVFLAMELVPGQTLGDWLSARPRSWREILRIFVEAGQGLAAAHQAGLVHRDFKPSNVIVGDDGRARVLDFGLARADHVPAEHEPSLAEDVALLGASLTQVGSVIGTPRYMAPEQRGPAVLDGRTDQFAFCVALHEALYGVHPFHPGATGKESVLAAMAAGELGPTPRGKHVPARLRRVLARGMAFEPEGRFPSMVSLLAELQRDRAQLVWRLASFTGVAAVAASLAFGVARPGGDAVAACQGGAEQVSQVWNATARRELHQAMTATRLGHAEETFSRVEARLDHFAAAWPRAHREACEATVLRHEQSEALMDRRMSCLSRRLGRTQQLLTLWAADQDGRGLEQAVGALLGTTDLADCTAEAALASTALPAPGSPQRAAAEQVLAATDRADVLVRAGTPAAAVPIAREAVEQSASLGLPSLRAGALLQLGVALEASGASREARPVLEQAMLEAGRAGDDQTLGAAWTRLIGITGMADARHDEALGMRAMGEALVAAVDGDPRLRSELLAQVALIHGEKGNYKEARRLEEERAALVASTFGEQDLRYAQALRSLGRTAVYDGDYVFARATLERAHALLAAALGESHPEAAAALDLLATTLSYQGELARAEQLCRTVLDIRERSLGRRHPLYVNSLHNLGSTLFDAGRYPEAREILERALAAGEDVFGPDHLELTWMLRDLGGVLANLGEHARAQAYAERALAIRERVLEPGNPQVATALLTLGQVVCERGQRKAGQAHLRRALAIYEVAVGAESERSATASQHLGECLVADGRAAAALPFLERCLRIFARADVAVGGARLGSATFIYARALWDSGRDRARALRLAGESERLLAASGGSSATRQEIARWRAQRENPPATAAR